MADEKLITRLKQNGFRSLGCYFVTFTSITGYKHDTFGVPIDISIPTIHDLSKRFRDSDQEITIVSLLETKTTELVEVYAKNKKEPILISFDSTMKYI